MIADFVDVHHGEGVIDWSLLRKNTGGAIIKAHDGYFMPRVPSTLQTPPKDYSWHFDPRFAENWRGAAGMQLRGAYSYVRFNYEKRKHDKDAGIERQAEMFVTFVKEHGLLPEDVLVGDMEQPLEQIKYLSRKQMTDRIRQWLAKVEDLANRKPIIYCGWGWWDAVVGKTTWAKNYQLWAADYTPPLRLAIGWTEWWGHQYTDHGKIPGIKGSADLNHLNG